MERGGFRSFCGNRCHSNHYKSVIFCRFQKNSYLCGPLTGSGAVGSARVWGARGRWFESSLPDKSKNNRQNFWRLFSFAKPYVFADEKLKKGVSSANRAVFADETCNHRLVLLPPCSHPVPSPCSPVPYPLPCNPAQCPRIIPYPTKERVATEMRTLEAASGPKTSARPARRALSQARRVAPVVKTSSARRI